MVFERTKQCGAGLVVQDDSFTALFFVTLHIIHMQSRIMRFLFPYMGNKESLANSVSL